MKTILDFINESQVNTQNLIKAIEGAEKLDPKSEENRDKLNVLAMDAIELYFSKNNENWDKKVNDELYQLYKSAFNAEYNDKDYDKVKEIYLSVANKVVQALS